MNLKTSLDQGYSGDSVDDHLLHISSPCPLRVSQRPIDVCNFRMSLEDYSEYRMGMISTLYQDNVKASGFWPTFLFAKVE